MAIKTLLRRMDAEIEHLLFGYETDPQTEISQRGGILARYTSDPFAAAEIIRRIETDGGQLFISERAGIAECVLLAPINYAEWEDSEINAKTAPLALTMAVLKGGNRATNLRGSSYVQLQEIADLECN